jgi:hypothetical protein
MSGLPQVSRSELGPTFGLTTWALKLDVTDCLVRTSAGPFLRFQAFCNIISTSDLSNLAQRL